VDGGGGIAPSFYRWLFAALWLSWLVYWSVSARRGKPVARHESFASRLSHVGPLVLAGVLFSAPGAAIPVLGTRFLPQAEWVYVVAAGLTAAGLLFTVWARRTLGANWSAIVTIKEGHELVTGGPYALVRHPIYTGVLLAIAGSAMGVGEWRAVLGLALAAAAFWRKLRLEERWMRREFGEAYEAYRRRVPALVPFVL
jgi:protein-S-isoprenylcysteine O-methyltransferase Ste14